MLANPFLGCLVSESGLGFTWAGNSQTNRLTVWSNDPVVDPPAEVIYLRDESTGHVWCPTPLPIPSNNATLVRHGYGYTTFEHNTQGIEHELTVLVPPSDPIKLLRLRVRNESSETRQLSATYYAELVLGQVRDASAMHLVTELDSETGALLARNAFRAEFAGCVAFVDVNRRPSSMTADRVEFLGRHGSVSAPAALRRAGLSGTTGAAIDPCAAIQTHFELGPGQSTEVVFFLGEAANITQARELIRRYRDPDATREAFESLGQPLGASSRGCSGPHSRTFHGSASERMASLSGDKLPAARAVRLLSVRRSVWISRPASGRDGARPYRPGTCPVPNRACGIAPIPRR